MCPLLLLSAYTFCLILTLTVLVHAVTVFMSSPEFMCVSLLSSVVTVRHFPRRHLSALAFTIFLPPLPHRFMKHGGGLIKISHLGLSTPYYLVWIPLFITSFEKKSFFDKDRAILCSMGITICHWSHFVAMFAYQNNKSRFSPFPI